jgi:2-oxoglutarate-Fe(II)-dependent dioxygenase family protein
VIDVRLKSWVSDEELDGKKGRIVGPADYNLVATGPVRLFHPKGHLLAVRLSGVLAEVMAPRWELLSSIRINSNNRGMAGGTPREKRGTWSRARPVMSGVIGAMDPLPGSDPSKPRDGRVGFRIPVCRLTSWTRDHIDQWADLAPIFQEIGRHLFEQNRSRYDAQMAVARRTHPDWVIPGTPFTTITVNNTYSTGVHQDAGDLPQGWSTLAVARRGAYTGGYLVLPRYRVAFDMADGDLLLFDAHEWHGNTYMRCPHQTEPLHGACKEGCERVSLVSYYRTRMEHCDGIETEIRKAMGGVEIGQ